MYINKNIMALFVSILFMVVAVPGFAVPNNLNSIKSDPACETPGACPYESWQVGCDGYGVSGPKAASSETWSVQLQNNAAMGSTSVRCWCDNTANPYANDQIENGTDTHWTFITYMTQNEQTCTCSLGETAWAELDPDTCQSGSEQATGFFYRTVTSGASGITLSGSAAAIAAFLALL